MTPNWSHLTMVLPPNGVQKLLLKAYPELRSQAIMLHPWRDLIGQLEVRVMGIRFVAMCNDLNVITSIVQVSAI